MPKIKRYKKGGKSFPDLTGDGKVTYADVLKGRLRKNKKSQGKGGKVEYGLGGAIMAGVNAFKQGKGLVGGVKDVAKAYATPGSGIAQGAKLLGGMAQNSNNPLLQKVGGVAGMASNFLPGGNPMAALSGLPGLMQAKHGMSVPKYRMKYAEDGMAVPEGEDPPVANFLLNTAPDADVRDFRDINDLQQSRADRQSAFGTASTDVYMPVGDVPTMPEPEAADEPAARPGDLAPIAPRSARLLKVGADRELQGGVQDMPGKMRDEFTGFITAPYLRTGQVPTNIKVRNPQTRQFEDRQMEPEEIADYIFKNQVRRSPRQMMTREQAMEKARQIMRSRS